jgi:hypothetical protein
MRNRHIIDLMRALTTDQERQICDVLEAMGAAEFYDSLISGGTFAVKNVLACSDEDALGILGALQGRQIVTIESASESASGEGEPAAPQARFRWRCTTQRRRI